MTRQTAVLYVEDDPSSRRVVRMLLMGRMGIQHVTILEDSVDFLARATTLNPVPDIIFLDIHKINYKRQKDENLNGNGFFE